MSEALAQVRIEVAYEKLSQNRFILNISYAEQDLGKAVSV